MSQLYKVISFVLSLVLIPFLKVKAQDSFGMSNSNYSPATTVQHNPSSIVDSEVMADIRLGGINVFLHTDYAYLPAKEFSYFNDVLLKQSIPNAQFNQSRADYTLFSSVEVQYLAGTFQYKEHGFGINSRLRSFGDIRNVPEIFANAIDIPQINGEGQIGSNLINRELTAHNVNVTLLSYAEVGVSYANAIQHFDRNLVIVGGTIKHLTGVLAGGLHIDDFNYRIDTSGVFSYNNLNATAVSADGFLGGNGWAFDVGITYKRMLDNVTNYNPFRREAGCRIYNYKWKVGASLIDLGYVKFKNKSSKSTVENASGSIQDISSFNISADPEGFLTNTLQVPDSLVSKETSFSVIVPAAFVFQYDYNFEKHNMFMSVEFMQGLTPNGQFGIQRPQVLIFTPRYETRYFELAFPFGMYNLQEVRTGLMVRIGPVSFGTDKLGTFLSATDVTGFDLYVNCSFKILQQKKCGKKRVW